MINYLLLARCHHGGQNPYDFGMPTDKAKLMVYMDPFYKDGLEKLSAIENRSMSNFVETLIRDAVDKAVSEGKIQLPERVATDK